MMSMGLGAHAARREHGKFKVSPKVCVLQHILHSCSKAYDLHSLVPLCPLLHLNPFCPLCPLNSPHPYLPPPWDPPLPLQYHHLLQHPHGHNSLCPPCPSPPKPLLRPCAQQPSPPEFLSPLPRPQNPLPPQCRHLYQHPRGLNCSPHSYSAAPHALQARRRVSAGGC